MIIIMEESLGNDKPESWSGMVWNGAIGIMYDDKRTLTLDGLQEI